MKIGRNKIAFVAEGHTPAVTGGFLDLTPNFKVEASSNILKGAEVVDPEVGVPASIAITIAGTIAITDEFRITLTSNDASRQTWRKSYSVKAKAGDTPADIAAALGANIKADGEQVETPYTAVVAGAVITVTAKTDDKQALQFVEWTDSVAGTITPALTPATISEGQPSDLVDCGIDPSLINEAEYDTVIISYCGEIAAPHIDTPHGRAKELVLFLSVGEGADLKGIIDGL